MLQNRFHQSELVPLGGVFAPGLVSPREEKTAPPRGSAAWSVKLGAISFVILPTFPNMSDGTRRQIRESLAFGRDTPNSTDRSLCLTVND
jgi:hypothetical protein